MNEQRDDEVWKSPVVVEKFLQGIRGAIPYGKEQLDVMMRLIDAGETAVASFLELGCGCGVLGAVILERYPKAKGVFLDFSRPMLDAARETVGERGGSVFVESDYGQAGWTERARELGPYDAVVSGYSIHHQPDGCKRQLYEEILDLLRPHAAEAGVAEADMDGDASLLELGVVDSFMFVELLVALQEKVAVEIDFAELSPDDFTSVTALTRVVLAAAKDA